MTLLNTNIGSAKDNAQSAVHNWYKFTAGFSYKFVDLIVDEMPEMPDCIYEPFAGCGTTLVAAQKKRIHSIGNESQQLMCDVINAKLNWDINRSLCNEYVSKLMDYVNIHAEEDIAEEYNDLLVGLYAPDTLKQLYLLRDGIIGVDNVKYQLFLKLALSQTLHKTALHPISVPYIVRSKNLVGYREALGKFNEIVQLMLNDLDTLPHHERIAEVFKADSRIKNIKIEEGCCDLCITSPPYLNNLDYGEVSKVHTHFYGLTKNWHDITETIRRQLVTGATTHYRDADFCLDDFFKSDFALANSELMLALKEKYFSIQSFSTERKGKKSFHILMMHYFDDMYKVLIEMNRVLRPGSKAYLILGDSAPYGVYIPTTQYLGEIALSAGFKDYQIYKIRDRGHKWKIKTRHNVRLSENILILNN